MSGPDTWMPWYIADFLAATLHMDADADGAYRRLIDACWMAGGTLTDCDETFCRITKLSMERWLAVREVVLAKFQLVGRKWHHKRVHEELLKARSLRQRARGGGRARAASADRAENGTFQRKQHTNGQLNGQPHHQLNGWSLAGDLAPAPDQPRAGEGEGKKERAIQERI